MKKMIGLLMVLVLLSAPAVGFAASPWTEKTTYSEKTMGKLEFGLKNALLGWIDIFYEPYQYDKAGKNAWSGLGKGIVDAVINEVGGVIHVATFLIPVDVPLPDNGVNLDE